MALKPGISVQRSGSPTAACDFPPPPAPPYITSLTADSKKRVCGPMFGSKAIGQSALCAQGLTVPQVQGTSGHGAAWRAPSSAPQMQRACLPIEVLRFESRERSLAGQPVELAIRLALEDGPEDLQEAVDGAG